MKDSTSQKSVGTTSALPSGQEAQTAYVNQRNRLINAASQTTEIVTELRKFIREGWAPTHPPLAEGSHAPTESTDVARLLDTRLEKALADIERLIGDTRTKVLVAGDLNTGKSTFINALLHRDVLPVDALPLTSVFCEVHSATENSGVEEVHVIKLDQEVPYNRANPSTYTKAAISDLEELQGDIDTPPDHALKVYVSHPHPHEKSLLANGIVDITLIDTPGLNTGLISPTGLFDRQEVEIIVLCLSAEYHLTLSASNFLRAANREKGFIVIAVNHYDRIRDKARCNRRILEQIKDISPHTYDNRDELIHFIDSKSALATSLIAGAEEQGLVDPSFISLESSIRSSVLHNLSKSKLMPAEDYLMMLLSDIKLLATSNAFLAEPGTDGAKSILEKSESIFDGLKAPWEVTRGELGAFEETARVVEVDVKRSTEDTANIPNGKLDAGSEPFTWRSILKAWDYTDESIPSPFWV